MTRVVSLQGRCEPSLVRAADAIASAAPYSKVVIDERPDEGRALLYGARTELDLATIHTAILGVDGSVVSVVPGLAGPQPAPPPLPTLSIDSLPPEIVITFAAEDTGDRRKAVDTLEWICREAGFRVARHDDATVETWIDALKQRPRAMIHIGHGNRDGFLLEGGFWWSSWWSALGIDLSKTVFTASSCQVGRVPSVAGMVGRAPRSLAVGRDNQIQPHVGEVLIALWTKALAGKPMQEAWAEALAEHYDQTLPSKVGGTWYWIRPETGLQWYGDGGVFGEPQGEAPPPAPGLPPDLPPAPPVDPKTLPKPDLPPEPEPELDPLPPRKPSGGGGAAIAATVAGVAVVGLVAALAWRRRPRARARSRGRL